MLIFTFESGCSLINNLNGNFLTVMNCHLICMSCQLSVDQPHGPENIPDTFHAGRSDTVWGMKMIGGHLSHSYLKITEASRCRTKLIRHFVAVGFHPTGMAAASYQSFSWIKQHPSCLLYPLCEFQALSPSIFLSVL